ncbi:MAG: tyrosine-type recombinase/integrase [Subdoligranulum variabile]|nr:tyrosine-type recombinase/integrase [Subdoligranulum variabile]
MQKVWILFKFGYLKKSKRLDFFSHSCASLLIKNKIPMKDVQVWMGHSSFATTANIYAHIDTDSKQEAADMISACISLSGSPDKKVGKKSPPKRSA